MAQAEKEFSAGGQGSQPSAAPLPGHLTTINVITYNCLGLKFISHYRKERLAEIGRRLAIATPTPEIVGLQECWTQEDFHAIRNQTRGILPHAKFYFSGIFGGGLAILSKWPIEESSMIRYPLNGRPTAFFRGDWFVGKGVACAKIRIGPQPREVVEVFCTHLHAPYESEPNDSYLCHRTAQAWEIAKLMRGAAERGHLVLGLGDFNMLPLSFAHQLITGYALVQDAWRVLHPDSSLGPANHPFEQSRGRPIPSAAYNLTENGAASDSILNTWRWPKEQQKRLHKGENIPIDESAPDPHAKRLDYLFVGTRTYSHAPDSPAWRVQDIRVGMTERHPTLNCSLSDHFSIEAILTRLPKPATSAQRVEDAQQVPSPADVLNGLDRQTYTTILALVSTYTARERRQRRLRLTHFLVSVIMSIGCLVAIWWSPRAFVSFLLCLISTLGLAAGIVDGVIGGLFVGSELRSLKEFEWEVRNAMELGGKAAV